MALGSVVDYLKSRGKNSSYGTRKTMAEEYGIDGYRGTAEQNTQLMQYLKQGREEIGNVKAEQGPNQEATRNNAVSENHITGNNQKAFSPSQYTEDYRKRLSDMENVRPDAFDSQYKGQIDDILDTIMSRPGFDADSVYDSDLYKNYRDNYIQQGQKAMRDATGNATAMTGGYGSTYAAAVGQQAYDEHLNQLNNRSIDIYDRLYGQYMDEGQEMYNQLNAVNQQDGIDYGRYRDDVSDYQWGLGYVSDRYEQSLAAQQWAEQYAYQKAQDALAQQNWQQEFDYKKAAGNASTGGSGAGWTVSKPKQGGTGGIPPYSENTYKEIMAAVVSLPTNKQKFDYIYSISQSDAEVEEWCKKLGITPTAQEKDDPKPIPSNPYVIDPFTKKRRGLI